MEKYSIVETFTHEDKDKIYRARLKMGALAAGIEQFDVEKAQKIYQIDLKNKELLTRKMAELELDYYESGARTLEEWADERDGYEAVKDSTGHDESLPETFRRAVDSGNIESLPETFRHAVAFATKAHEGQTRKDGQPYITHPLEVADIVKTMTPDPDVWSAAVLHDVVEDTPATAAEIAVNFGQHIADLVASDTENKREGVPKSETWHTRKQETLDYLTNRGQPEEKMIALADKLSNLRQIAKEYPEQGNAVFEKFNQKDPAEHAWYYRSMADATSELSNQKAWQEYKRLVDQVFGQE